MNPSLEETKMTLDEYLNGKYDKSTIQGLINRSDIVIFPEQYVDNKAINLDLIDLIKGLREDELNVNFADEESEIIEKRDSDLIINIGLICATLATPILAKVIDRLDQKYSKDDRNVKLTWYRDKKQKFFSYSGTVRNLSKILKELKDFD